jgi:predicted Zn-dependent peptidase
MEEHQIYSLPNGLRVIHKQITHSKIVHCGFIMDVGSRDETEAEMGIAHFWEHMAFKGTQKRKAYQILSSLDSLGGELNAYTTKEKICFYASLLDKHYEKAFELLTDITFNPTFPEKEIEKEKSVILEEMHMYQDSPDDAIQDEFEALVFDGHPLGYNILGTEKTLKSFGKKNFLEFIENNLSNDKLVFSSVGNIPFEKVKKLADKYLAPIKFKKANHERILFSPNKAKIVTIKKPISQAHCMIGRSSYSLSDERRIPFFMLINYLGGHAMNAKLNMEVREKHGLVYTIEASYTPFTDTGLYNIYFATEKKQVKKATGIILKELQKLSKIPLSENRLKSIKEQLMAQLAMAEESNMGFMMMMGRSLLDYNKVDSLNDMFDKIKKITPDELLEISKEMFEPENINQLIFLPE